MAQRSPIDRIVRLGVVSTAVALTACAQAPKPLYHWSGYQGQLYEHFKSDGSGPSEQARLLEAEAEKARAAGAVLPPGFHAHLGLVYLRLGRDDEAKLQLEAEKASFPESAQYMDFLLKRMNNPKS